MSNRRRRGSRDPPAARPLASPSAPRRRLHSHRRPLHPTRVSPNPSQSPCQPPAVPRPRVCAGEHLITAVQLLGEYVSPSWMAAVAQSFGCVPPPPSLPPPRCCVCVTCTRVHDRFVQLEHRGREEGVGAGGGHTLRHVVVGAPGAAGAGPEARAGGGVSP